MTLVYDLLGFFQAVVLFALLLLLFRGYIRVFLIFFLYVVWQLISVLSFTLFDYLYNGSAITGDNRNALQLLYARLYWSNDVFVDLLRFIVVAALIYRAASDSEQRPAMVGRILSGVVVLALVLPFVLFERGTRAWPEASWFNSASELLNFGAAIMNLVLWSLLIVSKKRDPLVLKISIGIGVLVAGSAASYGLRHFIPPGVFISLPNVFLMLTQLAGYGIWCWAFWPTAKTKTAEHRAVPST